MRTIETVKKTWTDVDAFRADMQTLDTATPGPLRWGAQADVATDFIGLRNDRTGDVLGPVKSGYVLRQAPDVADMALRAFEALGAKVAAVDYWATPARQWLGFYADAPVNFGGSDASNYKVGFGVLNSYDGSSSVEVGGIAQRAWCWNMVRLQMRTADKFKHNARQQAKLEDVLLAYGEAGMKDVAELGSKLQVAREVAVDPFNVGNILREHFGPRTGDGIAKLVPRYVVGDGREHDRAATQTATKWSLFNAATDYFTHNESASSPQARAAGLLKANDLLTVAAK